MVKSKHQKKYEKTKKLKLPLIPAEEIGLCNCAGCGKELLGERTRKSLDDGEYRAIPPLPPDVGGRIKGRPYCYTCIQDRTATCPPPKAPFGIYRGPGRPDYENQSSPWQDNNIRLMEDAG